MPIRFGGINTGLPPNIVEQLVEVERIPIKTMETAKTKTEERLKLVTELETKVGAIRTGIAELASTRGFSDIKLTSGDPNAVTGAVDPQTAVSGSWNIEVVSLAEKAAAITNGFPDKNKTTLGVGYFRFRTAEGKKDVYVDSKSGTLEGAAAAINAAHVGVRASVINDRKDPEAPYKLMISADQVGADNQIEYPTLYMLDGDQDLYFDSRREAKNGVVKLDGFEFEVPDNTLKDVIPGATLELKQSTKGNAVNITVKEDMEVVSGKIKLFVDSMNAVLSFIQTQNKVDKGTDTSKTLGGDGMIRSIEQRLRQLVQTPQYSAQGDVKTLNQLGIAFNRNGLLDFDQKRFNATLARNPGHVQSFLVGNGFETGFIPALKREIGNLLNTSFGPVSNRKRGLQEKVDESTRRIAEKERQLGRKEELLRAKFSRLEETMSKIRGQGSQLQAMGVQGGAIGGLTQG